MPTRPKSAGVNKRARKIEIKMVIPFAPTFCMKDQIIPDNVLCFKSVKFLILKINLKKTMANNTKGIYSTKLPINKL